MSSGLAEVSVPILQPGSWGGAPNKTRNKQSISISQDRAILSATELTPWSHILNFNSLVFPPMACPIWRYHRVVGVFPWGWVFFTWAHSSHRFFPYLTCATAIRLSKDLVALKQLCVSSAIPVVTMSPKPFLQCYMRRQRAFEDQSQIFLFCLFEVNKKINFWCIFCI